MASSSSPSSETTSTCLVEGVTGSHRFKVVGYSALKIMTAGMYIKSATFTVGGCDWSFCFYPAGSIRGTGSRDDSYTSVSLVYLSEAKGKWARFNFSLLDQSGAPVTATIRSSDYTFSKYGSNFEFPFFVLASDFEKLEYLQNDCFIILCTVSIVSSRTEVPISVPPSDLHEQLGMFLVSGRGADVSFKVGLETFAAHKIVLAARSPVLCTELYGPMMEKTMRCIEIKDMEPLVFKAMLHFIYTDSLPQTEELLGDGSKETTYAIVQHLLEAADRYGLDRLKLICEDILCKDIDITTVTATLVLAEQHRCHKLKAACFKYITSSLERLNALKATEGFKHLLTCCPTLWLELLEKAVCGGS